MSPGLRLLALGVTLLAAAGCSRRPSAADIERQLGRDTASCENIHIRDVKKVNGYDDGDNRYVAEVTYVIEFRKYPDAAPDSLSADETLRRAQCLLAELPLRMAGAFSGNADRVPMHQDIVMRRTENGWQIIESTDH